MSSAATTTTATTATAVLPLTTTFTPPSSCINNIWEVSSLSKTWINLGPLSTSECLPSGWDISSYYSPGLCPSGYAIAASGVLVEGTVTETDATCCPTNGIQTYSTRKSYTPGWTELEVCTWSPGKGTTTVYPYTWVGTDGSTTTTTASMSSNGHMNGYGISIRWQSTDFTTPASTAATSTSTTTDSSTTDSSDSSNSSTSSSSSSGLSTGAKAGIGIGVAAGAILAIAFLVLFFLKRRKTPSPQSQNQALPTTNTGAFRKPPVEMPAGGIPASAINKTELPAGGAHPNPQSTHIAELDGSR